MVVRVDQDSLDFALAHIERWGDTDVFPRPFEVAAIRHCWDDLQPCLLRQDLDTYGTRPLRRCMSPKGRYAYRIATQLDPLDSIIYTALLHQIGPDLEAYRVPSDEEVVFSARFQPSEESRIFSPDHHWGAFQRRSAELVDDGVYSHVVVADIADFFPRLYLHRIENTLQVATSNTGPTRAIMKMLKQWNDNVSYGLPVGSNASRLLAEVTINDIDRGLLSERVTYCRYSDDFRIFCRSRREAYEKLESLATKLWHNHGLSLQPRKTEIIDIDGFRRKYLTSPAAVELDSLRRRFEEIIGDLGFEDPYEVIDYDSLDEESKALIDSLNLQELLREQLGAVEIDAALFRLLLRRLGQLDNDEMVDGLIDSIETCYPVIPEVVRYLLALRTLHPARKTEIGRRILALIQDSVVAHLPFHRCWLLSLFTEGDGWECDQPDELRSLLSSTREPTTERKLVLAMGRAKSDYWFREMKSELMRFEAWTRRAFLAGASCLPADERKHWFASVRSRLDPLERAVVDWAKVHPF